MLKLAAPSPAQDTPEVGWGRGSVSEKEPKKDRENLEVINCW